ncbi:ECF transporter S component [Bacillus salacetis]|uniref:ECF transporter S component n=1 Tax=Bacillus salacetis TaxID=2315464 RepID=UPI003BA3B7C4
MMKKINKVTLLALLTALSAIGGLMKIPAAAGSVALDSLPALLAASIMSGGAGAVIAFFGHLVSALLAGMPLGALHLLIGTEMAVSVWLFGWIFHRNFPVPAAGLFFIMNGLIAPLPFYFLIGKEFYLAILPSLCIAAFLNLTIAHFAYPPLSRIFQLRTGAVR